MTLIELLDHGSHQLSEPLPDLGLVFCQEDYLAHRSQMRTRGRRPFFTI